MCVLPDLSDISASHPSSIYRFVHLQFAVFSTNRGNFAVPFTQFTGYKFWLIGDDIQTDARHSMLLPLHFHVIKQKEKAVTKTSLVICLMSVFEQSALCSKSRKWLFWSIASCLWGQIILMLKYLYYILVFVQYVICWDIIFMICVCSLYY